MCVLHRDDTKRLTAPHIAFQICGSQRVYDPKLMTTNWHMTSLYVLTSYVDAACLGDIETRQRHCRSIFILVIYDRTPIGLHTRVYSRSTHIMTELMVPIHELERNKRFYCHNVIM